MRIHVSEKTEPATAVKAGVTPMRVKSKRSKSDVKAATKSDTSWTTARIEIAPTRRRKKRKRKKRKRRRRERRQKMRDRRITESCLGMYFTRELTYISSLSTTPAA